MPASPFELILSKLPDARPVGGSSRKAWKALCPAHADSKPSLCVTDGGDGRVLIHCYAGCPPEAIVEALGLRMADLMPQQAGGCRPQAGGNPPVAGLLPVTYASSEEAIAELERRLGPCSRRWVYHDDCEDPIGYILRWDTLQGKEIRPVSRQGDRWVLGGMSTPRPLYRLVELLKRRDERVYVTEGEKAADAAIGLGLLATTSPHGSASAGKADWRPLAGRDVVLLPDNDDAGTRYALEATDRLLGLTPPATVRIVALPELPPKGDIYDWLEQRDAVESKDLRTRLETLVAAAPVCSVPVRASLDSHEEKRTPDDVTTNGEPASPESRIDEPVLVCAADVAETPIRWLWPGRMSLGRITLLVGRPGEGKSFLTTDMAARVSRGLSWPDGSECPEGSVLLICAEDDLGDTIRPRLRAHGADLGRVHLLSMVRRRDPDGGRYETMFTLSDVGPLEGALAAHPDCKLIVVDPIGSFLGGKTDAHRDNDVRSILVPVAKLAEQYDAAVLVVAHRRKSAGGFADDLALGSRAFTGIARAVWHVSRDRDNKARRLLLPGKNNLAAEGQGLAFTIADDGAGPAIRWESEPVDMNADEAIKEENADAGEGRRAALDDAITWLQEALADGPVPAAKVFAMAESDGIAEKTLKRAKNALHVRSWKEGNDEDAMWFWGLSSSGKEDRSDLFGATIPS
jgi:hypothetical protein